MSHFYSRNDARVGDLPAPTWLRSSWRDYTGTYSWHTETRSRLLKQVSKLKRFFLNFIVLETCKTLFIDYYLYICLEICGEQSVRGGPQHHSLGHFREKEF